MPGVVRKYDQHVGHAGIGVPFHRTFYNGGSSNVFVDGRNVIRKGDKCVCGDPAVGSSPNVFANSIPVHRQGDATGGHGPWHPNKDSTASNDVFANS